MQFHHFAGLEHDFSVTSTADQEATHHGQYYHTDHLPGVVSSSPSALSSPLISPISNDPHQYFGPWNSSNSQGDIDEEAARAVEREKRLRNTAASARFRIKKKRREQEVEEKIRELTERESALDVEVSRLEMENKWLRDLLVDKTEFTGEMEDNLKPQSIKKVPSRSAGARTDGIGTGSSKAVEALDM
jgi:hypothetical protein